MSEMTAVQMIEWIKQASYEDLLRKWRFEPAGSPWFQGDVGDVFNTRFHSIRVGMTVEEMSKTSKSVGWDYDS